MIMQMHLTGITAGVILMIIAGGLQQCMMCVKNKLSIFKEAQSSRHGNERLSNCLQASGTSTPCAIHANNFNHI